MSIELGSKQFWTELDRDPNQLASSVLSVDATRMSETLQQHPSLRAWLISAYETAAIETEQAETRLTKAKARALLKAKEEDDPHTEKPKTVPVLTAEVETNPEVLKAEDEYFIAKKKKAGLAAMSKAGEDRLQVLIQLSANERAERKEY